MSRRSRFTNANAEHLSHDQKIMTARFIARRRLPYFGTALLSLIPRAVPGMMAKMGAGMAVTRTAILLYDPDVIEKWSLADVEFGLLHETMHIIRDHVTMTIANGWNPQIANLAYDAAINDDLIAAGLKPLPSDMLPHKITHPQTMEPMETGLPEVVYYHALLAMDNPPKAVPGARPGSGMCGGGAGNPLPGEENYTSDGSGNPGQGDGNGDGNGNGDGDGEGIANDGAGNGANPTEGGRSESELEQLRKETAEQVQSYAKQNGRGSVPKGWAVWAEDKIKPPKIRWQDELRKTLRGAVQHIAGMMDYSLHRPSRQQGALGYGPGHPILPTMVGMQPKVAVAVDTSGSMGQDDLALALAECKGILEEVDDIQFLSCDAKVHGGAKKVHSWTELGKSLKGGGGTYFTPIFEAVERLDDVNLLVVLTDGGGPGPALPPKGFKVIWVLVGDHACEPWVEGGGYDSKINYGEKIWVRD